MIHVFFLGQCVADWLVLGFLCTDETFGNLHGRVFPLLGLEEKVKVRTNFGRNLVARPFKWQGQDDGEDSKKEEVDKEGDKTPQET